MKAWLVVVVCACGGAPAPRPAGPAQPNGSAAGTVAQQQGAITPDVFCDRFVALRQSGCGAFASMDMTKDDCVKELAAAQSDPASKAFMDQTGQCIVGYQQCDDVVQCLASLGPDKDHLRACAQEDPGKAVGISKAEWEKRNGAGVTKFSQAKSTKDRPIEVCTIDAENEWLSQLRCDDGSQPIDGHEAAEMARVGNLGKGGRCGSIIDLYRVKCPEASYDVYVDGYVCPLPE
jgi:hypothetical protein